MIQNGCNYDPKSDFMGFTGICIWNPISNEIHKTAAKLITVCGIETQFIEN